MGIFREYYSFKDLFKHLFLIAFFAGLIYGFIVYLNQYRGTFSSAPPFAWVFLIFVIGFLYYVATDKTPQNVQRTRKSIIYGEITETVDESPPLRIIAGIVLFILVIIIASFLLSGIAGALGYAFAFAIGSFLLFLVFLLPYPIFSAIRGRGTFFGHANAGAKYYIPLYSLMVVGIGFISIIWISAPVTVDEIKFFVLSLCIIIAIFRFANVHEVSAYKSAVITLGCFCALDGSVYALSNTIPYLKDLTMTSFVLKSLLPNITQLVISHIPISQYLSGL
jgi:hypothetical protein